MTALDVRALTIERAGRRIVDAATFAVARGECVAVMGPSGSGKTTILRAVAGLDAFAGGTVSIGDATLSGGETPRGRRAWHRHVGLVFQFHHLFAHMTALQNVWLAPVHAFGRSRADAEARARALLHEMGVGHRADAMPHELSGGEAQRVAIARAMAVDPAVLLLDEPTASLDQGRREELATTLRTLAAGGTAILATTHDVAFARAFATRLVRIADGRVTADRHDLPLPPPPSQATDSLTILLDDRQRR